MRSFSELSCHSEVWSSYTLDTCFDDMTQEIVFKAVLPDNSWLGIGFGTTMDNTDMIAWTVNNKQGSVKDLYSTGEWEPAEDVTQNLRDEKPPQFD